MEISSIPKTFWHALSFCMVIATLGILYIAYQSSSVSIEIANAKITLSSALATSKEIKSALENENERLKKANEVLISQTKDISGRPDKSIKIDLGGLAESIPAKASESFTGKQVVDSEVFKKLDMQLQQVQTAINKN